VGYRFDWLFLRAALSLITNPTDFLLHGAGKEKMHQVGGATKALLFCFKKSITRS